MLGLMFLTCLSIKLKIHYYFCLKPPVFTPFFNFYAEIFFLFSHNWAFSLSVRSTKTSMFMYAPYELYTLVICPHTETAFSATSYKYAVRKVKIFLFAYKRQMLPLGWRLVLVWLPGDRKITPSGWMKLCGGWRNSSSQSWTELYNWGLLL